MVVQTQQQKDAALAAQQANIVRLLRAKNLAAAVLYSSRCAHQLQPHVIRVLCAMNMLQEATRVAEEWGIQEDSSIQRMLQVHITLHMSHVARRTLHVTRRVSRHKSRVTRHSSLVTQHMLRVTRHVGLQFEVCCRRGFEQGQQRQGGLPSAVARGRSSCCDV